MNKTVNVFTCDHCGSKFKRAPSKTKRAKRLFCGKDCANAALFKHGRNAAGYRMIRIDGKQVYEHRWLMEKHLGRKLNRWEHVHHRNCDKADNRIENLEVLSESKHHSAHVTPRFDITAAYSLYKSGFGYKKLSQKFGVASQNIRGCFIRRGLHIEGRTKTSTSVIRKKNRTDYQVLRSKKSHNPRGEI